jgi:hypothetical protein
VSGGCGTSCNFLRRKLTVTAAGWPNRNFLNCLRLRAQGAFKFLKGQSRDIFLLQIFYQTTHGLIDLPRSDSDILFCKIFVKLFEFEISKLDSPLEVRSKKMLLEVTQFFSAFKSS